MSGTLLTCWERGYERKLAVVTDETGAEADVAFYQMRFWTEDGFKDQKRGGWRWEQTKMTDPQRASRLWLAMAVTMLWAVRVGSEEEGRERSLSGPHPHRQPGQRGRPRKLFRRPRGREESLVVRGQQTISVAVMVGRAVPVGHVIAQPWPRHFYAVGQATANWKQKCQHGEKVRRDRHTTRTWKQLHQQHLQREREREAKRLAKREQRLSREREQQAKRLARLGRREEEEIRRQQRPRFQEQGVKPPAQQPLVHLSHGCLILREQEQQAKRLAQHVPPEKEETKRHQPHRFQEQGVQLPARKPLVSFCQGRLVAVPQPMIQENPP